MATSEGDHQTSQDIFGEQSPEEEIPSESQLVGATQAAAFEQPEQEEGEEGEEGEGEEAEEGAGAPQPEIPVKRKGALAHPTDQAQKQKKRVRIAAEEPAEDAPPTKRRTRTRAKAAKEQQPMTQGEEPPSTQAEEPPAPKKAPKGRKAPQAAKTPKAAKAPKATKTPTATKTSKGARAPAVGEAPKVTKAVKASPRSRSSAEPETLNTKIPKAVIKANVKATLAQLARAHYSENGPQKPMKASVGFLEALRRASKFFTVQLILRGNEVTSLRKRKTLTNEDLSFILKTDTVLDNLFNHDAGGGMPAEVDTD